MWGHIAKIKCNWIYVRAYLKRWDIEDMLFVSLVICDWKLRKGRKIRRRMWNAMQVKYESVWKFCEVVVHDIYWCWGGIMVLLANHRGRFNTKLMLDCFLNVIKNEAITRRRYNGHNGVCVCSSVVNTMEEQIWIWNWPFQSWKSFRMGVSWIRPSKQKQILYI